MCHATNLGHALRKTGFVARVVVADQAALPLAQEGAGMFTSTTFRKVVDHGLEFFEGAWCVGPEVCSVGLFAARLEHLDWGLVGMHHAVRQDRCHLSA